MRRAAFVLSLGLAACASTSDPYGPPPEDDEADGGLAEIADARVRPDATITEIPRSDAAPAPLPADAGVLPPKSKRIFVSSSKVTGDLKTAGGGVDGLDGADKYCQSLAAIAQLGGSWKAWISSGSESAIGRMSDTGPYYRLDGVKLFDNRAAMAGEPLAPINVTEAQLQLGSEGVWTGTYWGGVSDGPANDTRCNDWTSADGDHIGLVGILSESSAIWTDYGGGGTCDEAWHVYCVEQ